MDSHDTLTLPSGSEAVPLALQWIEAIADRQGWAPRTLFGLTLSLDEALTNVLSYAFDPPRADSTPAIAVSCRVGAQRIEIELRDNGRPYDPTAHNPPPLIPHINEAGAGGHGVRLMRHYLDTLDYQRRDGWNCLTMTMKTA
ncbi:ATP-binding protein [Castellaniella sp. WN]